MNYLSTLSGHFIGASPDSIVECLCHGKGTFEIKCPYCHRGEDIVCAALNKIILLKKRC